MPCTAIVGQFYRHPVSRRLFEVTHIATKLIRVVGCHDDEPLILLRTDFEQGMEQVSA